MRRRLEAFIPIILFSIMVQLLAPIGAFRAVAHAVSDPLYMATICSGMASTPDASHDSTVKPQHGANCCGFCGVSHGGASVDLCGPAAAIPAHRMAGSCGSYAAGACRRTCAGARATRHFLTT
jgi:hypothetical protein